MNEFKQILKIIHKARNRAFEKVNEELINLYWQVGEYLYNKLESKEWGSKVIDKLAEHIKEEQPQLKGFNRRGELAKKVGKKRPYQSFPSSPNNLNVIL